MTMQLQMNPEFYTRYSGRMKESLTLSELYDTDILQGEDGFFFYPDMRGLLGENLVVTRHRKRGERTRYYYRLDSDQAQAHNVPTDGEPVLLEADWFEGTPTKLPREKENN